MDPLTLGIIGLVGLGAIYLFTQDDEDTSTTASSDLPDDFVEEDYGRDSQDLPAGTLDPKNFASAAEYHVAKYLQDPTNPVSFEIARILIREGAGSVQGIRVQRSESIYFPTKDAAKRYAEARAKEAGTTAGRMPIAGFQWHSGGALGGWGVRRNNSNVAAAL